jgi:hypothetical protein
MAGKVIPFRYKAEKERYSESSKRSYGWQLRGGYYADIEYVCRKCKRKSVFSAFEQKKSFENRNEYLDQCRVFCSECWRKGRQLKAKLREMEQKYCEDKAKWLSEREFLLEWLNLLKEYAPYTRRPNVMRMRFIEKHLTNR